MKKRYRILSLAFAVFLAAGAGCGTEETKTGEEKVLRVVTDSLMRNEVEEAGDFFERENQDWRVAVEVLPMDQQEREARIQKLKTEAMAGKGMDVYVLKTANTQIYLEEDGESVFSSVPKTMESGVFAPLDEYMEKDAYWKTSTYHPEILKAGQMGGKQYVLPLGCTFCLYYHPQGEGAMEGQTLEQWLAQAAASGDQSALRGLLNTLFVHKGASLIQPAVDYENRTSRFDAGLWADTVNAWFPDYLESRFEEMPEGAQTGVEAGGLFFDIVPAESVFQAVPDLLGQKTAEIQAYGAVGQTTAFPEEAYDFLMLFLDERREEAQTDVLGGHLNVTSFPVQERSIGIVLKTVYGREDLTEAVTAGFRELDGAYFPGETERELDSSFFDIRNYSDTLTEEERTQRVNALAEQYAQAYEILAKE